MKTTNVEKNVISVSHQSGTHMLARPSCLDADLGTMSARHSLSPCTWSLGHARSRSAGFAFRDSLLLALRVCMLILGRIYLI